MTATKKLSMAELRANFKKPESTGGFNNNYYPFYNIEFDAKAVVRFLPDKNTDNPLGFLVEKLSHTFEIGGEKKSITCLKQYGKEKDCPFCKESARLYKLDNKVEGKKFYRNKQHIGQVLVIEDPLTYKEDQTPAQGTVKLLNVGFTLYKIIDDAFNDNDLDEVPWDFEAGTNFQIKKTKKGEFANYESSKFVKHPSALTEDELAIVSEKLVDLSTLIPAEPTTEQVNELYNAVINGTPLPSKGNSSNSAAKVNESEGGDNVSTSNASAKSESVSSAPEQEPETLESNDAERILAEIRKKREAAKQAQ
jgi:hypothetical protein